ncbi:hypothetical protein LCGC14_0616400 [marine sediment metagenome]|uniref:Uncharacterized protein n=1 Tax=marine sediment metagenome TaxID=412755 RepID=A0A0F9R652_9ZZZZ|nr:hypothetical protein [bacterium]
MKSIKIIDSPEEKPQKKESYQIKTLNNFVKQYRDPNKLAEAFPSFKKRVRKVTDLDEIPRIPQELIRITEEKTLFQIIKWYSTLDGRTETFFDDGSPLPKISEMQIISQVTSMISKDETKIYTNTWILKRG